VLFNVGFNLTVTIFDLNEVFNGFIVVLLLVLLLLVLMVVLLGELLLGLLLVLLLLLLLVIFTLQVELQICSFRKLFVLPFEPVK